MAFEHGKDAVFWLDNASESITDYSAYVDEVDFELDVDTHETTTFGKSHKTRIVGLKDGTFSISGPWDATFDAILHHAVGRLKTFRYGPQGGSASDIRYTGEAILTKYSPPAKVGDALRYTAEFVCTDTITRDTF